MTRASHEQDQLITEAAQRLHLQGRASGIMMRVLLRVYINPATGCWEWLGPTSGESGRGRNYPRMSLDGQTVAVHRVTWTCVHGYLPSRKQLDHVCRTRLCVNPYPEHTEMVTHKQNCKRRDAVTPMGAA